MKYLKMKEQLIEWMGEMKHGYKDSDLYLYEESILSEEDTIRIRLYTEKNEYCIVATVDGYLGCIGSSRKPRAGEDWTRGNDLADGDFSKETWNRILGDIVGYELVRIHRPIKCLYDDNLE